jgi:hypothetical protein
MKRASVFVRLGSTGNIIMLSLVDLKDFAEICRALEEHVASGGRLEGPNGPRRRLGGWIGDDPRIADGGGSLHRFYSKAGGLE